MAQSKIWCELTGKKKKKYKTENQAISAALDSSARFGCPYRIYKCPHAPHWHLTTKKGRA